MEPEQVRNIMDSMIRKLYDMEILNFQGSIHRYGVGSFSIL